MTNGLILGDNLELMKGLTIYDTVDHADCTTNRLASKDNLMQGKSQQITNRLASDTLTSLGSQI